MNNGRKHHRKEFDHMLKHDHTKLSHTISKKHKSEKQKE